MFSIDLALICWGHLFFCWGGWVEERVDMPNNFLFYLNFLYSGRYDMESEKKTRGNLPVLNVSCFGRLCDCSCNMSGVRIVSNFSTILWFKFQHYPIISNCNLLHLRIRKALWTRQYRRLFAPYVYKIKPIKSGFLTIQILDMDTKKYQILAPFPSHHVCWFFTVMIYTFLGCGVYRPCFWNRFLLTYQSPPTFLP